MIVGREKEIAALKKAVASDEGQLISVYGRRRVGKTYLINEALQDLIFFRHTGINPWSEIDKEKKENKSAAKKQLEAFYYNMLSQGLKPTKKPKSWFEAFYLLQSLIDSVAEASKKVLFIDEIQWMDTKKSDFLDAFCGFVNNYCFPHHLKLVVCGSSSSWILDRIIHNRGGLYHRSTLELHILPFTLCECEAFFKSNGFAYSRYDIAKAYMALGGIPFYLGKFDNGFSVAQNIDRLFFDPSPRLEDEFHDLFRSQFANGSEYENLVRFLAKRKQGFTIKEIEEGTGKKGGGSLSDMLKALQKGMFVVSYKPFGMPGKELLHKLVDPFCLFFIKQIEPVTLPHRGYWQTHSQSQSAVSDRGNAFESLCFAHVDQIKAKLKILGIESNESAYFKKGDSSAAGVQIDMLIQRKDNVINLCEAKFVGGDFILNRQDQEKLERRCETLRQILDSKCSIQPVLITTFGVEENAYSYIYPTIVTLDDLFAF